MKLGFAVLLGDESHNFARKIELELCNKFGLCWGLKQSPHITIKAPFNVKNVDPFVRYLEDLARKTKPFEIQLEGFGYFEPRVIFLNVKQNTKLKTLHFSILKDMKKSFHIKPHALEGEKIRFHCTLALQDVTKKKLRNAKEYLRQYHPRFRFKAKSLGVFLYLGKEAGWIILSKVKLGNLLHLD
ncbi:MAG TPA: 2'-5' RNA ligase family protein [Candidatus Nanoarchaeia archaeon]|nr:2'-5' RNA ligase family protein [Candidatus Nanoarchaeia archaeon]